MGNSIYNTYEDRQRWNALMRLQATKEISRRYAHIQRCDLTEEKMQMPKKEPHIVFVLITCEGCHKRYAAGINPDTLPETVVCPGCGTEIEIVRKQGD